GRVGIQEAETNEQLEDEIAETRYLALASQATFEEALDEEQARRNALEKREKAVLNELQLAAAVHRTLVPNDIHRDDVEVAVRHIPTAYVGGDYLRATVVANRWLYLIVGDVSGHGVAAALVVARLHGLIRRLTLARRARPVTILERVNRSAMQLFQHTYFFMTMAVMRLDLVSGRLLYATAGHPAQVLLRTDGRITELRTRNRLLGIDADIFDPRRPSASVKLEPGDSVVLFTDGLFEILGDRDGTVLGEEGLHERIASLKGLGPTLMVGEILDELADFQGRSTFRDDVTLMVATWKGSKPEPVMGLLP
ncbi:MAG: PP2C family protein-serine/threonine phosphatase, partial [Planctomycetota bacterium]